MTLRLGNNWLAFLRAGHSVYDFRLLPVPAVLRLVLCGAAVAQNAAPLGSPRTRPGPDILYAPPASSPQLEKTGVWTAAPILVSGATAYRNGEFLYQDFLYDDRGARGRATYPGDKSKYAGNAADLVEFRLKHDHLGSPAYICLVGIVCGGCGSAEGGARVERTWRPGQHGGKL